MKHCKFQPLVSALLDNEVTAEERMDIESHLEQCAECRSFLETGRNIRKQIREAGDIECEMLFTRRVMTKVFEREREFLVWQKVEISLQYAVVALFILVVLTIGVFLFRDENPDVHQPLVAMTDSTISVFSFQPVDVSRQDIAYAALMKSQ